jgi:hypothetical protein
MIMATTNTLPNIVMKYREGNITRKKAWSSHESHSPRLMNSDTTDLFTSSIWCNSKFMERKKAYHYVF